MPIQPWGWLLTGLGLLLFIISIVGLVYWHRKKPDTNKDEEINSSNGSNTLVSDPPITTENHGCSEMQQHYALVTNTQTSLCPPPPLFRNIRIIKEQALVPDPHKLRGTFNLTPTYRDSTPSPLCPYRVDTTQSPNITSA